MDTAKDLLLNLPLLVDSNIQGVFWVLSVIDGVGHAVEQVEVHGLVGWDFHVLEQVPQLRHLFEAVQTGQAGQALDFLEKFLKIEFLKSLKIWALLYAVGLLVT